MFPAEVEQSDSLPVSAHTVNKCLHSLFNAMLHFCAFFFFFLRWCLLFLSMLRSCSSFLPSPKAPGNQSVFCLYRYCISMVSYDRGTFCLAFSFSILYSKFICFVVYVRTSFLFMANNILLYIYIIIYLSFYLLVDIWAVSIFWLLWIMLL